MHLACGSCLFKYHIVQLTHLIVRCPYREKDTQKACSKSVQVIIMSAVVQLDSSITLTTALKRPISSPKLAVASETSQLIIGEEKSVNSVYPVPHCVLLTRLETAASSGLLESVLVSEEAIASMVKELELENLQELPELHLEFSDWPFGVVSLETR